MELPEAVVRHVGYSLSFAQAGERSSNVTALQGFGGADVLEIRVNFDTDTFRAVYTVRFEKAIYVLHCFQKRSHRGIKTDPQDIELIRQRLKAAEADYKSNHPS